MRHKIAFSLFLSLLPALILAIGNRVQAQSTIGTVITVRDVGDSVDAVPGDGICADAAGKCTLRAAIDETNATVEKDAIIFDVQVPAVITLTLGELKTTSPVGIFGRGARNLTIQRTTAPNSPRFRVFHFAAYVQLHSVTVRNGHPAGNGGGILVADSAFLFDVAITGNRANAGGGIAIQGKRRVDLDRCLVNMNVANGQGGGMYVAPSASAIVKSSTFTNNSALVGGAIANYGGTFLANDTIARNMASQSSSSILSGAGGLVDPVNTIIGPDIGQTATTIEGVFRSSGGNIVTNVTGSTGFPGVNDQISANNSIDPMLGQLADNGGPLDSISLLPGSPAIDRGERCVWMGGLGCGPFGILYDLDYDQRRYGRVIGNVDIGALESVSAPNSSFFSTSFNFGNVPQIAYSRVTATNTETLETAFSFTTTQGGRPMSFAQSGIYLIQIRTKRLGPLSFIVCNFAQHGCGNF